MGEAVIWIGILVLFSCFWGFRSMNLMKRKGYNEAGKWFICGFLLWFIGFIIAAVQPNLNLQKNPSVTNNEKSLKDKLAEIDELYNDGVISRLEYDTRRKKILEKV